MLPKPLELHVVHLIPGRLRAKCPSLRDVKTIAVLQPELQEVPGVRSVEFHPLIGSVLVLFDPRLTAQQLMDAITSRLPHVAFADPVVTLTNEPNGKGKHKHKHKEVVMLGGPQSPSHVARQMIDSVKGFSRTLHDQTGGVVDLATLVPMMLFGGGVYRTAQGLSQGITMMLHSVSLFVAMHHHDVHKEEEKAVDEVLEVIEDLHII